MSYNNNDILPKSFLFDVGITNARKIDILEYFLTFLTFEGKKYYIVTPNPEIIVYAHKHPEFRVILNRAQLSLCDGIGLIVGSKILGIPIKERFTGVDFLESVCKTSDKQPITVGFLGGEADVAVRASECLVKKYPNLRVAFALGGNPDEKTAEKIYDLRFKTRLLASLRLWRSGLASRRSGLASRRSGPARQVDDSQKNEINSEESKNNPKNISKDIKGEQIIDILFVGFGFPKQEEWIARYLERLPVRVAIGVGGAFDYISADASRAPSFIRSIGLEWLYRLIKQPWRLNRQLALIEFIGLVLKDLFYNRTRQ